MQKPGADALIVALAKKKVAGAKPSKKGDYKACARDILRAVKSGNEEELADALKAFADVHGADSDSPE